MEHLQSIWAADRRAPVDALLAQYFKARRYIGSKDRGAISELVSFALRHGGALPELEDEMCDFGAGSLSSGRSANRLDALVWAITALAFGREAAEPKVRRL